MRKLSMVRNSVINWALIILLTLVSTVYFSESKVEAASVYRTIYVKTDGNDANDGSSWTNAKQTISGARDLVRTLTTGMTGDIRVIIRGGSYYQSSTLQFTELDSGKYGYNVIYMNETGGTNPVISGGTRMIGWTNTLTPNVIQSNTTIATNTRSIWVSGSHSVLGRVTNEGSYYLHDLYPDVANKRFRIPLANVPQLPTGEPVEIVLLAKWTSHILRIDHIDTDATYGYVYLKNPERDQLFNNMSLIFDTTDLHSYYFQNSSSYLDNGGEFFRQSDGKLLYYLKSGESAGTVSVVAGNLTNLVNIKGVSTASRARNIIFNGICFAETTFTTPNTIGLVDFQSSIYYDSSVKKQIPAAVTLENAAEIDFRYCKFIRLGTSAISLYKAATRVNIDGCRFDDVGGAGVELYGAVPVEVAGAYDDTAEYCDFNRVANSYFNNCGKEYYSTCPIAGYAGRNNVISHNEINNAPYTGISWGWGWGYLGAAPIEKNAINHNYVHNIMTLLSDGGGLYTLENQKDSSSGLEIFENYFKDFTRSPAAHSTLPIVGTYFDAGTSNVTLQHNVYNNCVSDIFRQGGITNITEINNATQDTSVTGSVGIQSDVYFNVKTWNTAPAPTSENAARNRMNWATSSLSEQYHVDRATDNDISTLWCAASTDTAPKYNLGLMRGTTIKKVELVARQDLDQPAARQNLLIEATADGVTWIQLGAMDSTGFAHMGTWTINVSNTTKFHYVRVRHSDTSNVLNFAELRVFNDLGI